MHCFISVEALILFIYKCIHVHLRIDFLYDKLSRKSFVPCQLYRIIPETKRKQGFRNVHA